MFFNKSLYISLIVSKIMKAKLFMGMMYSKNQIYEQAIIELEKKYGKITLQGQEFDFNFTNYYENEMGGNLKKRFVLFKEPIDTEKLAEIKLQTINIENNFKTKGKRQVNIDPGYISDKVVVASTKGIHHRKPIGKGIFADTQLKLGETTFRHTFADYKQNKEFFIKAMIFQQ